MNLLGWACATGSTHADAIQEKLFTETNMEIGNMMPAKLSLI